MIPLLGIAKDLGESSPMKDSAIGGRVPVEAYPSHSYGLRMSKRS